MPNNVTWKHISIVIALLILISSCVFGANAIVNQKDERVLELVDLKLEVLIANVELMVKSYGLKPIRKADLIRHNERRHDNGKEDK